MVEECAAPPSKRSRLTQAAFGKGAQAPSIDLKFIATTATSAAWYSPKAQSVGQNIADLSLMNYLHEHDKFGELDKAFLSCFAGSHCYCFRRVVAPGKRDQELSWRLGLWNFGDTAAITWPVEFVKAPMHEHEDVDLIDFRNKLREPECVGVVSWDNLVARPYRWRSPAWLKQRFRHAPNNWLWRVRAVLDGPEVSLKVQACRDAFWNLDSSQVRMLAHYLGVALETRASLFDMLMAIVMRILGISEAEALELLGMRLRSTDESPAVTELLQLEEAAKLLHPRDEELLIKEQRKQRDKKEEDDLFRSEFAARRKAARVAAAKAAPKPLRRLGAKPPSLRLPAHEVLDHATAKTMAPPKSYVWRAFSHSSWEGRLPPHGIIRKPWAKYSSSGEALRTLVCALWVQYHADNAIPHAECPVLGVFGT